MSYVVYILRCADDTLYTGVTNDIEKRLLAHNTLPSGAKYTKARRPVKLVYQEKVANRSEAQKREAQIKSLTRKQKEVLLKK